MHIRFAPLALAALAPLAPPQSVHVLGPQPAPDVDFTDFASAFGAASSGDILLVRPGDYTNVPQFAPDELVGKGLTIVGEGGPVLPWIRIRDLGASQNVVVRGLRMSATGSFVIEAEQNAGVTWLEDVRPLDPTAGLVGAARASVSSCASVVVQRCRFDGTNVLVGNPDSGFEADHCALFVNDSTLRGGTAYTVGVAPPPGPGLEITDTVVFLSGCTLVDGDGPTSAEPDAVQAGNSSALLLDCVGDWSVLSGDLQVLSPEARHFESSAVTREGESILFQFGAPAGELAILNITSGPGAVYLPGFVGAGLISLPILILEVIGPMPGSETLQHPIPVPFFPPGFEGATLFAQGSFASPSTGTVRLGGASAFVVLDEAK